MQYSIQDTDLERVVKMEGGFNFSDTLEVKRVVGTMVDLGGKPCTLDLTNLTNIDSAGLGMIILMSDAALDVNSVLTLKGAQGQVRRMLDVSNFSEIVAIE